MERLLTNDEIIQLAQEQHKLALWKKVQQAAVAICGESAYKVTMVATIRL